MDKQVVISNKTVVFTLSLLLAGYVLYRLGPVLGVFLLAILIVISIEPLVKRISGLIVLNRNVPRGIAVFVSYIILILILVFIITSFLPPFVIQAQKLIKSFVSIVESFGITDKFDIKIPDLLPQTKSLSEGIVSVFLVLFSNITTLFTMLIISLYISLDLPNIKKKFYAVFPKRVAGDIKDVVEEIETSVGAWVKGELLLMTVVGLMSFTGLMILDVNYAGVLALLSGLLEVVPMFGPIVSAVIAAVIGFSDSAYKGVGVIALYVIVQQLENNILVPKVMQKVSGFSPIVILFSLMVGGRFFGLLGAILAVPMAMVVGIILKKTLRIGAKDEPF